MNKQSRRTLIGGLITVALLITGLWLYHDRQNAQVVSSNATIRATTYSVGVDYSGILVDQRVQKGQMVQKGQILGLVKSGTLIDRLREAELTVKDLPYSIDSSNQIELKASNSGVIADIRYNDGSFVPANQDIYTIIDAEQYYVSSEYLLTRPQVDQVENGKRIDITLADGTVLRSRVRGVQIQGRGAKYLVTLESLPDGKIPAAQARAGAPVDATLLLQPNDTLSQFTRSIKSLWPSEEAQ